MRVSATPTYRKLLGLLAAFALLFSSFAFVEPSKAAGSCPTAQCATLKVHYKRTSATSYNEWGLWLWAFKGTGLPESTVTPFSNSVLDADGFGYIDTLVPISAGVTELGLIPRMKSGWTKDMDQDRDVKLDANKRAERQPLVRAAC